MIITMMIIIIIFVPGHTQFWACCAPAASPGVTLTAVAALLAWPVMGMHAKLPALEACTPRAWPPRLSEQPLAPRLHAVVHHRGGGWQGRCGAGRRHSFRRMGARVRLPSPFSTYSGRCAAARETAPINESACVPPLGKWYQVFGSVQVGHA